MPRGLREDDRLPTMRHMLLSHAREDDPSSRHPPAWPMRRLAEKLRNALLIYDLILSIMSVSGRDSTWMLGRTRKGARADARARNARVVGSRLNFEAAAGAASKRL